MRTDVTRRRVLGTLGLAAASTASAGALAAVPVPASAELHRLIEASRKAEAAWDAAESLADAAPIGPEKAALKAEARRLLDFCDPALLALVSYPVASLDELRIMIAHLREPSLGPWGCDVRIDAVHVEVFLDTILTGAPARSGEANAAGFSAPAAAASAAPPADPMLAFVHRYRAALRDLDEAGPHDDDFTNAFCAERINPLCEEARAAAPATTTPQGAAGGVRLALFLIEEGDADVGCALLKSAAAFLDGRAA